MSGSRRSSTSGRRPRHGDVGYLERYVLPRFGPLELGEIDHMMVRTWVAELSASGLAPSTTTKAAQLLSKIMRAAVQAGYLPKSPCDGVRLPRIERVEMRFLNPHEVMTLADAMDPAVPSGRPSRRIRRVACGRTLRAAGQASGSSAANGEPLPRPSSTSVAIRTSDPPRPGPAEETSRSPAWWPIHWPSICVPLGDSPTHLVFTAPEGGPVQLNVWRWRFWAPAVSQGRDSSTCARTTLRHTAVALWMAAGANPKEVAARAGHTSVSFTLDRYGHLLPGSEQRLNDAIDALAEGAQATAEVTDDTHDLSSAREKTISFAHVARTPEDSKDNGSGLASL